MKDEIAAGAEHRSSRLVPDGSVPDHVKAFMAAETVRDKIRLVGRLDALGDPHQALPVGHAGAMGLAIRHADATVELTCVHRFRDPAYAALTLQLRNPRDAAHAHRIAAELDARGHIRRVDSHDDARTVIIDDYFSWRARGKRVAVVTATNKEADLLNETIQQRRFEAGELSTERVAFGRDDQRILIGDTVQTRRNDTRAGVENRAQWVVRGIHHDSIDLVAPGDSGQLRRVTREYALAHLQLAYATTVHGVQGETVDAALVGPDVDAAGLYVGLTRGRLHNTAYTVAGSAASARATIAATMTRGTTELTIHDAIHAAQIENRRAAHAVAYPHTPLEAGPSLSR